MFVLIIIKKRKQKQRSNIFSVFLSARGTRALIHLAFCSDHHHHYYVAPFSQIHIFFILTPILPIFPLYVILTPIFPILSARGTRALFHLAFCHHCHVAPFPQIRHFIISSVI